MKRIFLLLACFATIPVHARTIPAIDSASSIPDARVFDETGADSSLQTILASMGGGPVLLVPIYTRCAASCPLQTQKVKKALAELNSRWSVRVLMFSFDPEETTETIAQFRKNEAVPPGWRIVRARYRATRNFLEFFHYPVMQDSGQFAHPDQIFVLDASLRWQFTVTGLNWTSSEMKLALDGTRSPGVLLWVRTHPDELAWAGLLCVLAGIGLLEIWLIRQKALQGRPAA